MTPQHRERDDVLTHVHPRSGSQYFSRSVGDQPRRHLVNDFLYDIAQMTIATDNVDESFVRKPRHWDIRLVRDFMLIMGSMSSLYDIVTFVVLFLIFNASPPLFRTGWFVESFAMQTLVVFVIRTAGNPFRSRPSSALAIAMVAAHSGRARTLIHPDRGRARLRPASGLVLHLRRRGRGRISRTRRSDQATSAGATELRLERPRTEVVGSIGMGQSG